MGSGENGNREREIFETALAIISAENRRAFLKRACADDTALRLRVEALLEAHQAPEEFLPGRPKDVVTRVLVTEKPGDRIGNYKLLQQIGEGGCGVVYMAEQVEPIRRRVALKVIKLGMETKQVMGRFEAERQALALMDHPNIAKVLDAGATATGRPYFVMELVRGTRITDYCDENRLSTEERLNLFVQVCQAIQHAHQKGIIHRDIKPSNILVTLNDGARVPKVIDFGIAKAMGQQLTEKTVFTAFEHFIGTPAYMSPEQAVMTSLDVDTRSDIYALGVLLYELLTGHTPFEPKELAAAGLDEMRRIIREQEPIRPSTRLGTLADPEQTTVAKRRHAEAPQLVHLLRGDLDWIVMKCLEKDRARRYATATGLAEDVLRHLQDEPVIARPPSRLYRLKKLARRNKVTFAAAAAVAGALVIGLGLSTWLFLRERAARARAVAAENVQSQLRQQAQAEAEFFKGMLEGVGPSFAQGRDTTMVKEILDKAAERIRKDLKNQPELAAELQSTIADTYAAFGQYTNAEQVYRAALAQREALWGNMSTNVADSRDSLGCVLLAQMRVAEAEPFLLKSLAVRTNLLGSENLKVAASLFHLGFARYWLNTAYDAEHLYRRSLAIRQKLLGDTNAEVMESLSGLSGALMFLGKRNEGEAAARKALAIQARLPADAQPVLLFSEPKDAMTWALFLQGRHAESEPLVREQLARYKKLLGPSHPRVAWQLTLLAHSFANQGKLDEAETTAREGLALSRKTVGDQHFYTGWCLDALALTFRKTGRLTEAEAIYREEVAVWNKLGLQNAQFACIRLADALQNQGKQAEVETMYRQQVETAREMRQDTVLCPALASLAGYLRAQGKLSEASDRYHQSVEAAKNSGAPAALAPTLAFMGDTLRYEGRAAQAEPFYRGGLELCRSFATHDFALRQRLATSLGLVLKAEGKLAEAETLLREAIQFGSKSDPPDGLATPLAALGDLLRDQGKSAGAESLYREGLEICRSVVTNDFGLRQWLTSGLSGLLRAQGRLADAEAICRETLEVGRRLPPSPDLARALIALAEVLRDEGRFAAAEPLYREGLDMLAKISTSHSAHDLETLVDLCGRQGQWKEAAAYARRLLKMDPSLVFYQLQQAAVLAETGDLESYQALCRKMMDRSNDPELLGMITKACLLVPDAGGDVGTISALAEKAVTLGKDSVWFSCLQVTTGLAEYRRGHCASAVEWMQKVLAEPARMSPLQEWETKVHAYAVLAMAKRQLGQSDEARTALAKGIELAQSKLPQLGRDHLGEEWHDWLIARILLREAKAIVQPEPGTMGPALTNSQDRLMEPPREVPAQ